MNYRRLGHSGLRISEFSLGSWVTFATQVQSNDAKNLMACAYDAGINFFDNAEIYASGESEVLLGKTLQQLNWPRDTYCVSSKVFWGGAKPTQRGLSAKHVYDACHAAMRRLRVDYLDLYFCHRPDEETPIEETVRAMHHLITQGKVIYWGTSEWSAQQIMQAHSVARQYNLTPPTMEQSQYNMFERQRVEFEYDRLYSEIGLGLTTFSPLASGILTGKYADGIPASSRANQAGNEWLREFCESAEGQHKIAKTRQLTNIAESMGMSTAQLALAFCLRNRSVSSVILGASSVSQLQNNLATLELLDHIQNSSWLSIEDILQNQAQPLEAGRWLKHNKDG